MYEGDILLFYPRCFTDLNIITGRGFGIGLIGDNVLLQKLVEELRHSSFPRRYIPRYKLVESESTESLDAVISWKLIGEGFRVKDYSLDSGGVDKYVVESSPPGAYINESPFFFILQVISRSVVKNNYLLLTDSVSFYRDGKTYLFLGYPHTGKSTLLALALMDDSIPLSTENTIVSVEENGLRIVNGTDILVYSPIIEGKYGVRIGYHEVTRHGYRIVDLRREYPDMDKYYGRLVDEIYVLHLSFSSMGCDLERVRGRKIEKIMWHFSTSIIRGLDYYRPYPLSLTDKFINEKISRYLGIISNKYHDRIYEVFGRHDEVYKYIVGSK
jgi:hypothetical protein